MQKLLKFVLENASSGRLDKQLAAQLIQTIQSEEIKVKEDIAIIGISAQLPVVNDDLDEFWTNIKNRVDFIGQFPETRKQDIVRYLDNIGFNDGEYTFSEAGYLQEIDKFDYGLFRLSPKEASLMDPYQRVFLQVVWHAIEDAGYGGKKLANSKTGVFVGYASNPKDSYFHLISAVDPSLLQIGAVGNVTAMIPSRISYLLDMRGPTMILDTACSSALVSVHQACQSIQNGDCDMAIAGSIRIALLPYDVEYLRFGNESSDGRTRTFDQNADGAGMGEAVVAIVLKPLKNAIKDKDNIYGVIKGGAITQDGASIGITAPNPDAQSEAIARAWQNAKISPDTLAYIEAHGTGTPLGDPIEIEGLEKAFRKFTNKSQFCAIGSVKTNVGHLFESSGLGGLLKIIKILQTKEIPPNLFFNRPNTKVALYDSPMYVNDKLRTWEAGTEPMRCGISSFGFSGTNCHLVVEEAPVVEKKGKRAETHLFSMSFRNEKVMREAVQRYRTFLEKNGDLDIADICYTANTGRSQFTSRLALLVKDTAELRQKLDQIAVSDLLVSIPADHIYYGEHKIAPLNKKELQPGEIFERDRTKLTLRAKAVLAQAADAQTDEQLQELCSLYIQGADLDWEPLYQEDAVRKVSLPGYPFERHRCWVDMPEAPVKKQTREAEEPQTNDHFFTMAWRATPLEVEHVDKDCGTVMLLQDDKHLATEIAAQYRARGIRVIEVAHGESFAKRGSDAYTINATEADYVALLTECQDITKIVHLATITDRAGIHSLQELESLQQRGTYGLFNLARAVAAVGLTQDIDVVLVSEYTTRVSGDEAVIKPENVTLFGLGKVVRKELLNLQCRAIDIDEAIKIERLMEELDAKTDVYQIAYRQNTRYTELFTETDLRQLPDRNVEVREHGVYLITGGTGGIGLETAKYLAAQKPVRLALINRSQMPSRERWEELVEQCDDRFLVEKIENIRTLEAMGATVELYSANVASLDSMQTVVNDVRRKFGKIDGVVHSAGLGGACSILERTQEDFNSIFSPKVHGTWVLDQLTREDNVDFFIMYSSIATLFSAPGQGDYIAANAYLDSYADYLNQCGTKALTVNWSTWKETGMSVRHNFTLDTLYKAMTTKDAINGLDLAFKKDIPRFLCGEINYESKMISLLSRYMFTLSDKIQKQLDMRLKHVKRPTKDKKSVGATEVTLVGKENGVYLETEQAIGRISQDIFGFDEINVYDNFFELGADSILLTRMHAMIDKEYPGLVQITDMFENTSIVTLAEFLNTKWQEQNTEAMQRLSSEAQSQEDRHMPQLETAPEQEYYPASSGQKRFYFLQELDKTNTKFNIPLTTIIEGPLDLDRVRFALQTILDRHETLRTYFELVDDELVQRILPNAVLEFDVVEIKEVEVDEWVKRLIRPFDLSQAPLFHCGVAKLNALKHVLAINMHHIVADGISMDVLVEEFAQLYQGATLDPLAFQYKDYAVWQHKIQEQGLLAAQEQFWLDTFRDNIPTVDMPTSFERPETLSDQGGMFTLKVDGERLQAIQQLVKRSNSTLFMVLLSALNVLLSRYTGQEDVIIGTPTTGRTTPGLEKMIGLFINTLAMRNFPQWDKTFKQLMSEVKTNTLASFRNQEYQFDDIVNRLKLERKPNRQPLFDVVFVLQNVGVTDLVIDGLAFSPLPLSEQKAEYDLYFEVIEKDEALTFNLVHHQDLYTTEAAQELLVDLLAVLDTVCDNEEVVIGEIEVKHKVGAKVDLDLDDLDLESIF